jgi:hypothetical protein
MTSALEALDQCDGLLAYITPNYRAGLKALTDALPGISGRSVGAGSPSGGSSISADGEGWGATTVVERAWIAGGADRHRLERYEALPGLCVSACDELGGEMGLPAITLPAAHVAHMQWAYSSWVVLLCIGQARYKDVRIPSRPMREVQDLVNETSNLIHNWTGRTVPQPSDLNVDLVTDLTETWCRRCLKYGHREPRSPKHTAHGLCRWCGDFKAVHGWWPTESLLEARHDGHKITEAMVKAERPRRRK